MALQPRAQLRRKLEAVDKFIPRRDFVFLFNFLDDFRIALRQNVERELAHRFRPRRRWCNSRHEFQRPGRGLSGRGARETQRTQHKRDAENGCFSHAGIVADCEESLEVKRKCVRTALAACTGRCLAKSRKNVMAARPASSTAAAIRQSKLVGAEGIGPCGRFGGLGGSSTPMPVNLRGGPPPRVEDARGSSSDSYSEKSYGTKWNITPCLPSV